MPTPSSEPTDESPIDLTGTTKTPTPTKTRKSDSTSSSSGDASNKSENGSSNNRTILMAVIAAVAAASIISLLVLCCKRQGRNHSNSDEIVTPIPILTTTTTANNNNDGNGYHPSFGGVDRVSDQLRDSKSQKLSINTAGYGGLPMADNGLPKYAVTSPEMPANYRVSARQSRLADFNRRTRSGNMSSLTATSPAGSHQTSGASSFTNALRNTNHSAISSFSIRGESDISASDHGSYASQISSDVDDSYHPRITTNLKMNRFSRTSSMASSSLHGGGSSSDIASFINHDLTRSASESTTSGEHGEQLQSSVEPNDGKSWYKSIRSPSEQERYTAQSESSSLGERESFEL